MTKLCICQICTCGSHKCPHRPWGITGKGDQQCAITEYKNEYRAHDASRTQPFKPDNEYKSSGQPLADETTHKHDYIRHSVEKPTGHQPDLYRAPEGEMDTMTSYAKEYTVKNGERAYPIRQDGIRREPAQFEGNPTYKADYRQWDLTKTQPIKRDGSYMPSEAQFAGESTYVYDYKKHNQSPVKPIRPDQAPVSSGNFDDRTGYRDDYIKHNLPEKYNRPRDEYQANKIPLDGLTTMRRDFTAKDAEKMRSFKPEGGGYRSDAPFNDDTTHKQDYKRWEVQAPHAKRDQEWHPPLGEMDMTTNYSNEYTKKPVERVAAVRPEQRTKLDAKFDGNTTYHEDFRKWPGDKRELIRADNGYHPSGVPFDGQSTYKGHYIPLEGGPAASFKPDGLAYRSGAPFDGNTMYRSEYTHKEIEPCPAGQLDTHRSDFVFAAEDDKGHKYYQKTASAH